jgi:hypothetical protein
MRHQELRPEYRSDPRNMLNLSLTHFETRGIEPLGVANWRLHSAIQRLLRSDPLRSGSGGEGVSIAYGAGGDRKVRFASGPASLRQILNGLAVSASGVVWVVTYAEDADATRPFQPMVILTTAAAVPEDRAALSGKGAFRPRLYHRYRKRRGFGIRVRFAPRIDWPGSGQRTARLRETKRR